MQNSCWECQNDFRFWMAAEVINLERTITITGDKDDFHGSGRELHSRQEMKCNGDSEIYVLYYTDWFMILHELVHASPIFV